MKPTDAAPAGPRPLSVTIVSLVALVEGIALLVVAAVYLVNIVTGAPVLTLSGAVFLMVLFAVLGLGLLAVGHFLFRGYRWPRSGALVAQLFVLTIGVPTLQSGLVWLGILMIVPAAVAALLVFDPKAVAYGRRSVQAEEE
ncbi:hypothetical protein [Arthrobacter sp. NPDC090010]|uniref:hypothetical protein n=1 Tax=Arthrobacter sp. NPDC090010 TaxID=3363942 RepID=UPI0037F469F0